MFPSDSTLFYTLVHTFFRILFRFMMRLRVEGREHVPRSGGCILVCNHTFGHDYLTLGVAAPRKIVFMVKVEALSYHPFITWMLRTGGVVPVHRGVADVDALKSAVTQVKSGRMLGMFPEGTRSPDGVLQSGKPGTALIGLDAKAPIIPAVVIGSQAAWNSAPRFWRRPEVIVRFGPPFKLEGDSSRSRPAIVAGTKRIMTEIAALLPPEQRGKWGDR